MDDLPIDYSENLPLMAQARDRAVQILQEQADRRAARRNR